MTTKGQGGKTPKSPRSAGRSARSTDKRAGATSKARTRWPDKVKAEALTLLREEGMAAAHDVTSVPKATLSRWAKAEGIDLDEGARQRTATAAQAVRERAERAKLDTVKLLEDHIGEAGSYLSAIVTANAAAAEAIAGLSDEALTVTVDDDGNVSVAVKDEGTARLRKLAMVLDTLPLAVRDAEGIVTRAIHDVQLLRGEATERGELVVEFGGIPRPDPGAVEVDQLTAADED